MQGGRELYKCSSCGKKFFYYSQTTNPTPKVVCYFCGKESYPKGEPVAVPPQQPPAKPAEPAPALVN